MKTNKFLSLVGAGAMLVSIAGAAAADVRYGESASEWLSESVNADTAAQSIAAINQLNDSAPAASGSTGLSVSYGEAGIEWLASASAADSVGLQSIDEVNQLNQSAPAASGKATDRFYSDDFWMAE